MVTLNSCAPQLAKEQFLCPPAQFREAAVPLLANQLLSAVRDANKYQLLGGKKSLAVNLFSEETTGSTVEASKAIVDIIVQESKRKDFSDFTVTELTGSSAQTADYFVNGFIHYGQLSGECNIKSAENFYSVEANVIERKTATVIAKSKVWIQNKAAVSTIPLVEPPTIRNTVNIKEEVATPVGSVISAKSINQLSKLDPILNEAEESSKQGDYTKAVRLFEQAIRVSSDKGEQTRIYNGLYRNLFNLRQMSKAEEIMGKLVAAAANDKSLSFYILFETARSDDAGLAKPDEYAIWIRQIGKYFNRTKECLQIIGHTSITGSPDYNLKLSKERAETIRGLLENYYPEARNKAIPKGEGSNNCKRCAPDDNVAKVDRRVEFKMVKNCANLSH